MARSAQSESRAARDDGAVHVVGGFDATGLAGILLAAAMIDIRWLKNRHRIISKVYVAPSYHDMPELPSTAPDSGALFIGGGADRAATGVSVPIDPRGSPPVSAMGERMSSNSSSV